MDGPMTNVLKYDISRSLTIASDLYAVAMEGSS